MKRVWIALCCTIGSLMATALLVIAQAPWTNGQDAAFVIGQPDFTTSASGVTTYTLYTPKDVAIDLAHGKLYVADRDNNRVLRFSYPITQNLPAAELVFGQPDFSTGASGTTTDTFNQPYGLDVDGTGRLWVVDRNNNRVVWFDGAYAIASHQPAADGLLGQTVFTSSVPATTQGGMNGPSDLIVADSGVLWVADRSNNRVVAQ